VKGVGSWASYGNDEPWRMMDFAVPQRWYGKVQAGLTPTSDVQEKKEKKKEGGVAPDGRLAVSMCYVPCRC
jgi:hypothetical protein